jgi:hypothetical protein
MSRMWRTNRKLWRRIVIASVVSVMTLIPTDAFAYSQDVYVAANNHFQSKCGWCVVGSGLTWLAYIPGSTISSQATVSAYMTTKDKYPGQSGSCIDPSDGKRYYGHDPRGWAWAMYQYTPAGYTFNDYKKSGTGSQAAMDWQFVYGVRADGHPDGAIVEAGEHAIDILGYSTLNDPFSVKPQQLNGFYIFDPWFGRGNSGMPNWPYNGFAANSYVTISTWNSTYYKPDTTDGAFWNNTYDGVLRSSSGTPTDSPTESYGDYVYNQVVGLAAPAMTSASEAASPTAASMAQAITSGLGANDLAGTGGELNIDLAGYAVGPSVHVTSLASGIPSYDLVELLVGGSPSAIALVQEVAGGFAFGAITPVSAEPLLMSPSGRESSLSANGMTGSGALVWAPSTEGGTPFAPFIQGNNSVSGQAAFLSLTGPVSSIVLSSGLTPAGQ